jgi:ferredoxin
MIITRKEFFRQGLFSLSKTALDIAGTLSKGVPMEAPVQQESEPSLEPRPDMLAEPFNERCLARNCGCFACAERCEPQAIVVVPGVGIRIDDRLCNGCGSCEYVCPVQPKAVILAPRPPKNTVS